MSKHVALCIYNLNIYVINLLCYRLTRLYILHMSKHIGMANTKFKRHRILPDFRKNIAFGNVPRLRQFVLLVSATRRYV
jgi:hypothetical protein